MVVSVAPATLPQCPRAGVKHRFPAAAALVALMIAALAGTAPASAATPAPAQPTFVATSPVLTFAAHHTVTTTVQVLNPGPATQVRFEVVLLPTCTSVASNAPVNLVPTGLTTLPLSFHGSFDTSLTGATLLMVPAATPIVTGAGCARVTLSSNAPATPAVSASSPPSGQPQPEDIVLTLHRDTSVAEELVVPAIIGLLFALVAVGLIWMRSALPAKTGSPDSPDSPLTLATKIKAGSSWNYKDSLATNVTVVGAVLGSVIGAAGSSSKVFPGVDTSHFALVSALWAGVVLLAPLVIGLASTVVPLRARPGGKATAGRRPSAAGAGQPAAGAHRPAAGDQDAANGSEQMATSINFGLLLVSLVITLTAVGAEIATLWVFVSFAAITTAGRVIIDALIVLAALLVAGYVMRGTVTLVRTRDDEKHGPRSRTNAFADTALAG